MLNFGSDADITRIKIAAVLGGNKNVVRTNIYILGQNFGIVILIPV